MSRFCPSCGTPVPTSTTRFCESCGQTVATTGLLPRKGWYPETVDSPRLRYWDGRAWTKHTVEREAPPSSAVPVARAVGLKSMDVAFISYALACALSFASIRVLQDHGSPGGDAVLLVVSELLIWAPMLMGVFVVSKGRGTGSLKQDFDARISSRDIGPGVLGGLVGRGTSILIAVPLYTAFHNLIKQPNIGPTNSHVQAAALPISVVVACIGAPIIEELFFRGLIQTRLVAKWGPTRGIAATSVLFGAAHLIGWQGPSTFLSVTAIAGGGAVLGYLRQRTGRLGPGMVAHCIFNLIAVLF